MSGADAEFGTILTRPERCAAAFSSLPDGIDISARITVMVLHGEGYTVPAETRVH